MRGGAAVRSGVSPRFARSGGSSSSDGGCPGLAASGAPGIAGAARLDELDEDDDEDDDGEDVDEVHRSLVSGASGWMSAATETGEGASVVGTGAVAGFDTVTGVGASVLSAVLLDVIRPTSAPMRKVTSRSSGSGTGSWRRNSQHAVMVTSTARAQTVNAMTRLRSLSVVTA